jgi:hypothetical protein
VNHCRGEYVGGGSLGAHWTNYGICKTCGKRVRVLKGGNRLWAHAAKKAKEPPTCRHGIGPNCGHCDDEQYSQDRSGE